MNFLKKIVEAVISFFSPETVEEAEAKLEALRQCQNEEFREGI
jgi:hypothetical protein